jgi:hypothetical protein
MTLDEKKEIIVESFKRTFDKGMAYEKATLTEDEIDTLNDDQEFQSRLQFYIIKERERVINNYKEFMDSENERIAFEATKDFAKLLYPEYFIEPKLAKKVAPEKNKAGEYDLSKLTDEELAELAKQVK